MNSPKPHDHDSLSLSREEQINELCRQFEAAWQDGQTPKLEDFLEKTEDAEAKPALLHELLAINWHYGTKAGTLPPLRNFWNAFQIIKR